MGKLFLSLVMLTTSLTTFAAEVVYYDCGTLKGLKGSPKAYIVKTDNRRAIKLQIGKAAPSYETLHNQGTSPWMQTILTSKNHMVIMRAGDSAQLVSQTNSYTSVRCKQAE